MYELQPNIWVNEVALDGYNVRSLMIRDEQQAIVWDTLSHPQDMDSFLPLIGGRKLTIVYSHGDWDHIWGTAGLPYETAQIVGHKHCQDRFNTDIPLLLVKKKSKAPKQWSAVELVAPTLTFQKQLSINLTQTSLTLSHLPGHTPDSIVAFLPETGLLLMGDTVENPFPFIPEYCPINIWIQELMRWEEDSRVRTVVPSHGKIGGREILQQNINYLQNLRSGQDCSLPRDMTDFYIKTHQENMRVCKHRSL